MLPEFKNFLDLVERLSLEDINRSENDLSTRLSRALESLGLHTVVDTGGGANRRPRPDILCYVELGDADLVVAADALVESKKPVELQSFPKLSEALISSQIWDEKFLPYVHAHAARVLYFCLTDFRRFLAVAITSEIRSQITAKIISNEPYLKSIVRSSSVEFNLQQTIGGESWSNWCEMHLIPSALSPPPISSITNLRALSTADDLERFASELTDVVVGTEGRPVGASLVLSIEQSATHLDQLPDDVRRALLIYTMAQHSGMGIEVAQPYLNQHLETELRTFVAASIHSLVGRLFAFKTIEDCFCVDVSPDAPLIEEENWVFHTEAYDDLQPEELPAAVFAAMERLSGASNPALRDLASTHAFYDWIAARVDPAAFRRLFSAFVVHDFKDLDGDLLGRFFELYAQRIDRRRRKEFGQYYTPQPIVAFMWRIVLDDVRRRGLLDELVVLDPGVGSGTFLVEAARQLEGAGIPQFWTRFVGFDIDPQVIAVSYVNVYLTVLGLLNRPEADAVQDLQLYPTDALDPANGGRLRAILPLLMEEDLRDFLRRRIELSEQIKRRSRFEVVIGNPPYRNNSNRTLAQVAAVFPRLLSSSRANARARARNIRDDYAWFFAAADYYITERGMIAYVVSDSFCVSSSYRWFREDLLRYYQVQHLIHLGVFLFRDVGPRTSFVIVVLERRPIPLSSADDTTSFRYIDLRSLAQGDRIGTPDDPRLLRLAELAATTGPLILPEGVEHTPSRDRAFALLPATGLVHRVDATGVPVHARSGSRIFLKKWPGIITAFDALLKADTQAEIERRMQLFFDICGEGSELRFAERVDEFSSTLALNADGLVRLRHFALSARLARYPYDEARVQPAVSGSAPNESRWYPRSDSLCWIYYEPRLVAERNVHEGRNPGWGTMSQWRDQKSHSIQPKLIYTTARHAERGLKAFVSEDPILCKLHGGTRQQFHYTGLHDPTRDERLDGLPNNLGEEAILLHRCLLDRGNRSDTMLFYVAGIYNSQLAEDYLREGGGDVITIPVDIDTIPIEVIEEVAQVGRWLRDLEWLRAQLDSAEEIDGDWFIAHLDDVIGRELRLEEVRLGGGRFRRRRVYRPTADTSDAVLQRETDLNARLDDAVERLYAA